MSNTASFVFCVFRRFKDHDNLREYSPLLKKACVRQIELDKWFPHEVHDVLHALQLDVADDDVLVHLLGDGVVRLDPLLPVHPLLGLDVEAEVVGVRRIRELDGLRLKYNNNNKNSNNNKNNNNSNANNSNNSNINSNKSSNDNHDNNNNNKSREQRDPDPDKKSFIRKHRCELRMQSLVCRCFPSY